MPDLIRLVHGNPSGLKKLVKEFRMYWKKKTDPTSDEQETVQDTSKLDVSVDADEKTDALDTSKTLNDSKVETQDEFAISKRQLEIKIPSIAVREKRPEFKKVCWYVRAEVLKQYSMEDIKLPNSWEYVCVKPTWAFDKPKTEESGSVAMDTTTGTPGKPAQSIMQFAQPMTVSQIQAQVLAKATKESQPNVVDNQEPTIDIASNCEPQSNTPGKPDQRSIKDMFSPAARKSINHVKSQSPKPDMSSPHGNGANTAKSNKTSCSSSDLSKTAESCTPTKPAPGCSNSPGLTLLRKLVSSPELMKTSPKQPSEKAQGTEEPMDVDIIVLD